MWSIFRRTRSRPWADSEDCEDEDLPPKSDEKETPQPKKAEPAKPADDNVKKAPPVVIIWPLDEHQLFNKVRFSSRLAARRPLQRLYVCIADAVCMYWPVPALRARLSSRSGLIATRHCSRAVIA